MFFMLSMLDWNFVMSSIPLEAVNVSLFDLEFDLAKKEPIAPYAVTSALSFEDDDYCLP